MPHNRIITAVLLVCLIHIALLINPAGIARANPLEKEQVKSCALVSSKSNVSNFIESFLGGNSAEVAILRPIVAKFREGSYKVCEEPYYNKSYQDGSNSLGQNNDSFTQNSNTGRISCSDVSKKETFEIDPEYLKQGEDYGAFVVIELFFSAGRFLAYSDHVYYDGPDIVSSSEQLIVGSTAIYLTYVGTDPSPKKSMVEKDKG